MMMMLLWFHGTKHMNDSIQNVCKTHTYRTTANSLYVAHHRHQQQNPIHMCTNKKSTLQSAKSDLVMSWFFPLSSWLLSLLIDWRKKRERERDMDFRIESETKIAFFVLKIDLESVRSMAFGFSSMPHFNWYVICLHSLMIDFRTHCHDCAQFLKYTCSSASIYNYGVGGKLSCYCCEYDNRNIQSPNRFSDDNSCPRALKLAGDQIAAWN